MLDAEGPVIGPNCEVRESRLGRFTEVGEGTRLLHVAMGDYSYCDRFCDIAHAEIGRFGNIAAFVRIGPTDHPLRTASLHHFLYRSSKYWADAEDDPDFFAQRRSRTARIGHDTWIGHSAVVKPEVTVGHGAVVAAGAVVTRDVEPYVIVAGVPARVIRDRQPRRIAERLMALAWWDWSHERLRAALPDFRTLRAEAFLEKHGG
ncbi:chloramphenicol acetyltransferase [Rubellimicrobium roseum]|uniref:Chloramphenicol acetyltransferase n=1 Tax=Rubellimicrobium roseum TaxID=687525 RepID=A0A5C4NBS3_9RHOB|nr:chloramphenicol acetyltransferase [Rubellimicrobium roseum]TNC71325.1 chloramphenicol acetyltransferase [Rubellimicrobium roseum]